LRFEGDAFSTALCCKTAPDLWRRGYFNLLVQAVRRGIPLPFGSIRNRRAFVAVENLCSFVVDRLTNASRRFDLF
jgi:UDP-glucose 4-epimerase